MTCWSWFDLVNIFPLIINQLYMCLSWCNCTLLISAVMCIALLLFRLSRPWGQKTLEPSAWNIIFPRNIFGFIHLSLVEKLLQNYYEKVEKFPITRHPSVFLISYHLLPPHVLSKYSRILNKTKKYQKELSNACRTNQFLPCMAWCICTKLWTHPCFMFACLQN